MLFSSLKPHRLHTCTNKTHTSLFIDKTFYSNSLPKSALVESNKPLLSFTSFQHYLEDCNQNEFYKREHERGHRSANKAKTQAHFNYQRQKINSSSAKRKQIKDFTLEDSQIEPFDNCDHPSVKHKNIKLTRNIGSKSSSDNYLHSNSLEQDIFNQKFGTIEGWNSEQKLNYNNISNRNFVSSNSILQQRKFNSIIKNRNHKTSQNSFRKQPKQQQPSHAQTSQNKPTTTIKQTFHPPTTTNKPRPNKSSNKQNICLTQPPSPLQAQDQLFRPIQIHQKSYSKNHPLTSINQLEEEILLSKRQPQFANNFQSPDHQSNFCYQRYANEVKENENIKMLKKEFEYLCRDDFDERWEGSQKTPLSSIQQNTSIKNIQKQLKYFKRFPNHQKTQTSTHYPFNPLKTNRPKTTQDDTTQNSINMLKILQSINFTTSNKKCLYESKTPVKRKNLPQSSFNTPHNLKKDDMKSISQQKERFHEQIKDRKSQSAFHYGGDERQENEKGLNERKENSLIITIVGSFKSCDSKDKTRQKQTSKNLSLVSDKNKNSRLMTEQAVISKQSPQQQSVFQKPFLAQQQSCNCDNLSDVQIKQSMSQTIDIMHSVSDKDNMMNEQNQSLQKLNLLSQQLKKCAKMPTTTKYINLANKRMSGFGRANNRKQRNQTKEQRRNVIRNLTITQLEGRHIEKLRKRFDLNNP